LPWYLSIESLGTFMAILAMYMAVVALVYFVLGWGLMSGKRWAPNLGLAFAVIGIVLAPVMYTGPTALVSLAFNVVITGAIYWYLTATPAKEWFRHA